MQIANFHRLGSLQVDAEMEFGCKMFIRNQHMCRQEE